MIWRSTIDLQIIQKFPGGYRGRVTPVPIPNTEVKPATADGTACAGVWESRSLPGLFLKARFKTKRAFSLYAPRHPIPRRESPPSRFVEPSIVEWRPDWVVRTNWARFAAATVGDPL